MGKVRRRQFLAAGSAWLLLPPARAQSRGKVARVGMLMVAREEQAKGTSKVLADRLGELGWRDGGNLAIDLRFTQKPDDTKALAASLVAQNSDVLVGVGAYPAHALHDATRTIPIVLFAIADPVGRGLVASLARPGGNITGVSHYVPGTGTGGTLGLAMQLLKEIVPTAKRFAFLMNPANPLFRDLRAFQEGVAGVAQKLALELQFVEARVADEVPAAIDTAVKGRAEGLLVGADPVFDVARQRLVALAEKHRLPAIYPARQFAEAGGLASYGTDFIALLRRAAEYVDRILRGAKPADLPIELPTKFEFVLNQTTANALGITFPPAVVLRADAVIG